MRSLKWNVKVSVKNTRRSLHRKVNTDKRLHEHCILCNECCKFLLEQSFEHTWDWRIGPIQSLNTIATESWWFVQCFWSANWKYITYPSKDSLLANGSFMCVGKCVLLIQKDYDYNNLWSKVLKLRHHSQTTYNVQTFHSKYRKHGKWEMCL